MKSWVIRLLTAIRMYWVMFFNWRPFIALSHDPMKAQRALLLRILTAQKNTDFGKEYEFANITSYDEYAAKVPVCDYEKLRPYIEYQENTGNPGLNIEHPVLYAQTSGTTAKPKYIPVTQSMINRYRRSQQLVAYSIFRNFPDAYHGKILAITSAAKEGLMKTGTAYGSMSGLIYNSMPSLMRRKYVLAPEVLEITDYQEKYLQIAVRSLAEKEISMIATANPSTLLKLISVINQQFDSVITVLQDENKARAQELQVLFDRNSKLVFADIWPGLRVIVTWVGGNCSVQVPELLKQVSKKTQIVELGYLSSEFRGSITVKSDNNTQIPCIHESFFEFVESESRDQGRMEYLTLDKILPGKQYYIFATTQNGLYRYDINDIIEVTGFFNRTPTIQFLQKGKGVISLTGEKLYESQLVEAINQEKLSRRLDLEFFVMLGDAEKLEYILYLEHEEFSEPGIEQKLCALNLEYQNKFDSGRLKPLQVRFLKSGTGEKYKQYCLDNGQREGQFKLVYLQAKEDCHFDFENYLR